MASTKSAPSDAPHAKPRRRPSCDLRQASARRLRPTFRGVWGGISAVAAVLSLAACSGGQAGTSPVKPAASSPAPLGPYVALGDSYTAGTGIPDQIGSPAGCERSGSDYPALVARHLHLRANQVRDVSCSGATIADLSAAQTTNKGANPAQSTALSTSTALVTLGIGGNDVDFAGVLTRCVELDLIPTMIGRGTSTDSAPCRAYYNSGGVDQIQQKIETASESLSSALREIKRDAPHARVYLVGYPDLLPSSGSACASTLGITKVDVAFLNAEETHLNDMLRQRAEAAGAIYVDTYTPSLGHDACADPAERWIEPLIPTSPAAPLHPNALGEQGMAEAVERAIAATA